MQFPKKSVFKRFSLNFRAILIALTVAGKRCIIPIKGDAFTVSSQRINLKDRLIQLRCNKENNSGLLTHYLRDF